LLRLFQFGEDLKDRDIDPQLVVRVRSLIEDFAPDGLMLAQCQQLDSWALGRQTILPYGPRCTFKQPPKHPFSPKGLSSDMAVVIAITELRR
jgi:hypothetical protein